MKAFFEAIQDFFLNVVFIPFDFFRFLELENWWSANIVSWFFIIICCIAIVYWTLQLGKQAKSGEENKDPSAHSYL